MEAAVWRCLQQHWVWALSAEMVGTSEPIRGRAARLSPRPRRCSVMLSEATLADPEVQCLEASTPCGPLCGHGHPHSPLPAARPARPRTLHRPLHRPRPAGRQVF